MRDSHSLITGNDCDLLDFKVELPISESVTGLVMRDRGPTQKSRRVGRITSAEAETVRWAFKSLITIDNIAVG